jgi:ribosome-interacting GTPase 1
MKRGGKPSFLLVAGFEVAKTGDARIGFIGFPSVGKSTLLSNLAGVYSEVAAYEFTVSSVHGFAALPILHQDCLNC